MAQNLRAEVDRRRAHGRAGAGALVEAVAPFKAAGGVVTDDLFGDLEVAFRGALGGLLRAAAADAVPAVESLVSLAVGYALAEADVAAAAGLPAPPTGKLPFLLFEDLLDAVPLEVCPPTHRDTPTPSLPPLDYGKTVACSHFTNRHSAAPALESRDAPTHHLGGAGAVVGARRVGAARVPIPELDRAPEPLRQGQAGAFARLQRFAAALEQDAGHGVVRPRPHVLDRGVPPQRAVRRQRQGRGQAWFFLLNYFPVYIQIWPGRSVCTGSLACYCLEGGANTNVGFRCFF